MPFEPIGVLPSEEDIELIGEGSTSVDPAETWEFDFNTGEFTGRRLRGMQAYGQAMRKALITERDFYEVYDDSYGSELHLLISDALGTSEYKELMSEDMITEAVIYDDRTASILGIDASSQGDKLYVSISLEVDSAVAFSESNTSILNLEVEI